MRVEDASRAAQTAKDLKPKERRFETADFQLWRSFKLRDS